MKEEWSSGVMPADLWCHGQTFIRRWRMFVRATVLSRMVSSQPPFFVLSLVRVFGGFPVCQLQTL